LCYCARAGERDLLDGFDKLSDFALLENGERPIANFEARACGEIAGKDDPPGAGGNVDKTAGARCHMRADAKLGHVNGPKPVDLQEGEQRHVESAALEVGELMRGLHNSFGVGRTAELEVK